MRALLLAENWPPRIGGIEHYLTSLAGFLPNGSVTVLAPRGSGSAGLRPGVYKVIEKRFFWPLLWPAWWPLFGFVKKLVATEKIEIILCGKALFEGLLAYQVKKALDIPYVVFTYAMEIEVWAAQNRQKLIKVLGAADKVVYINEATKKTLLGLGVTEQQLVKIWPGVDEMWLQDMAAEKVMAVGQKYNLHQPYILTGARLIERKGIDTVIEAFGKLDTEFNHYALAIFGAGPDEARLKKLAVRQNKKILFLGHVPNEDLPPLYKGAEMFALLPRAVAEDREGFGIVYLEAAAQGRAVLGSLSGGVPEAVIHNQTGILVQPNNVMAAKEGLEKLLTDAAFRERLGQAGKKRVDEEFRWQKRIVLVKGMIDAVLHEQGLKNS